MKILKRVVLSLLALISTIFMLAAVIWLNPGIILTQSRVDHYFDKFAGEYFSKKPEHLMLNLDAFGLSGKNVTIELTPFCLSQPDACFSKVHLEFAFKLMSFTKAKIEELGPLEILNTSFIWRDEMKKEGPENKSSQTHLSDHLAIPVDLKIKDINIEFPKFVIEQKKPITGRFFAHGKQSDQMNVRFDAKAKGMTAQGSIDTAFILNQQNPFKALVAYEQGQKVIQGNLRGNVNWSSLRGDLEGQVLISKFIPWIDTLKIQKLVVKREDKITLHADLDARFEPKIDTHHNDSALPKASFDPHLRGKFEATETADSHINYKVHLGPLAEKGIHLEAKAEGTYPFPKGEEYHYGLDRLSFLLDVPKFQTLVKNLKRTNSAVPAPFASMDGSVHFRLGNEDGKFKDNLPISLVTNLDSKEQTFKTESKGSISFSPPPKKMKIEGDTLIQSFRFTMPDLDILAPAPSLKTDSRIISIHDKTVPLNMQDTKIQMAQKSADQAPTTEMNWKIRTAPSGIQIFYPMLKPYAPVEVKWDFADENSGEVKLLPFNIEFLNRKAQVQNLRYYINAGDPTFHYEGRIVVPKTEYTIFINIIQDGEKPKIQMTSDPPLAESDIISVLLFNQTAAELDSEDTTSVASTQAAVANRALGIFTILTLSSTPIEAVNFNPATGIYSARVKLGQGLTATVGTDWDKSQEVALRKRLGRNFVLSTVFQTDQATNEQTTKTLIEWFKRY